MQKVTVICVEKHGVRTHSVSNQGLLQNQALHSIGNTLRGVVVSTLRYVNW